MSLAVRRRNRNRFVSKAPAERLVLRLRRRPSRGSPGWQSRQSPAPLQGLLTASINVARLVPGQHAGAITVIPADGSKTITIPVSCKSYRFSIFVKEVLSSATYAPTPVSPGLLVTITGLGLGPATGVAARPSAAGAFETQLAGSTRSV